ncbi:MAG: acyltransferase [Thermodesulfobacteriota bacterium]|nr:acyltransferase [Thermodesulfobacteriota bacterium]
MAFFKRMFNLLKLFSWDFSWRQGRYEYLNWVIGTIPGHLGIDLRGMLINNLFKQPGENVSIFPGVKIRGIHNLSVGKNVVLGEDVFLNANGGIFIDDEAGIGPGTKIWSVNHIFSDINVPVVEQGYEDKAVRIGKGVWIAANCTILPGAELGEGVIISAGSVVGGKKVKPFSVLAGNPARIIGSRVNH